MKRSGEEETRSTLTSLQRLIDIFLEVENPQRIILQKVDETPPRTQPSGRRLETIQEYPEVENPMISQSTQTENDILASETTQPEAEHSTVPTQTVDSSSSTRRSVQMQTDDNIVSELARTQPTETNADSENTSK